MKNTLIVSLHDVSPLTQEIVTEQLKELREIGVTRCSLLVIPNHHHRAPIAASPNFMTWLEEQVAAGHEIVLHGFYHWRSKPHQESFWKRWITEHYTAGEGEFYDLTFEQACSLLQEGKKELQRAGCDLAHVTGFIAPAWLLSKEAERAAAEVGFSYTTRLHGVIDLRTQPARFFPSQSMVYSVRSAWRRAVSLLWNEFLFRYATRKKWPLLRMGLHPVDWNHAAIRAHALDSIKRAAEQRVSMTYAEWLKKVEVKS